jgi:hypothetical protein
VVPYFNLKRAFVLVVYYLFYNFLYLDDDLFTYPVFRNYNMSRISALGYSTFYLFSLHPPH